jgi:hypothetical protein
MSALVATDIDPAIEAARITEGLLNEPVASVARIGGGRNSQVYRIDLASGRRVALKRYFQQTQDMRDRRLTEAVALRFLHDQRVTCVPCLLASDASRQASVLEFVPGEPVTAGTAARPDLDRLASFLVALFRLSQEAAAAALPVASEAVFTLAELIDTITQRLTRLQRLERKTPMQRELAEFLEREFVPALEQLSAWAVLKLGHYGLVGDRPLPISARTLSPSDFGLHNTLRTSDGGLVFVDFEYFGWDDPAKTISDFLLHPGMALSTEQRGWFLQKLLAGLGRSDALEDRLRVAYVLFGLKWVMIVLNEFVPERLARRLFADPTLRADEVQREQLGKARDLLIRSLQAQLTFPYEDWMGP